MSKRPVFVLPASGLEMDLSGPELSIRYDGDLVIEQTFGKELKEAHATGNLTIKLPKVTGVITAGGTLTVFGEIEAEKLHARQVVLDRQGVKCRSISATERIAIGPARLAVDIVIAPEIVLDPKISGRCTVVESLNEVGPTKIKGGFSLADYEDTIGNADGFLAERKVDRLDGRRPGAQPRAEAPAGTIVPETPADAEEVTEDPQSLSIDDMEPIAEQAAAANEDLHTRLADALGKIVACYDGTEMPPAISELRLLVEQRDYAGLRQNITEVWNGLLGFHQKRGIRPHHQVTHAFNVIHGLVQE